MKSTFTNVSAKKLLSLVLELTIGRRAMSDDESDDDDDDDIETQSRKDDQLEDFQIDPKDESAFNAFMSTNSGPRKTLADLVLTRVSFFVIPINPML